MAIHPGSWFGLPDFGITERLTSNRTSQGGSNLFGGGGRVLGTSSGPAASSARNYSQEVASYRPSPTKQVSYPSSSGGGGGGSAPQSNFNPYEQGQIQSPDQPFSGGPSEIDVINSEFNAFNDVLNQQESLARSNFDETKGLYDTQKANAEKQYSTERGNETRNIKSTESLNLKQVRQLLSDLSQRDAARTAITGGGSTSEVLAERFGREAQSRLGNVQDQTRQALERVNTFYDNAITKLNDSYQTNIVAAKQKLDDNLGYIQGQRTQSAAAKQRGVLDAWRSYYDQVNNAKIQAATFKAQYDLWKSQQDNALAATGEFNLQNAGTYNTGLEPSYSPLPQAGVTQPQQQDINPQFRMFNPQPGQEDEEAAALGLNFSPQVGTYVEPTASYTPVAQR